MRAAILSIGNELLRGDIVDTNAACLARSLSDLGFEVVGSRTVPDDLEQATEAVSDALRRAVVTVTTGGLGPTQDDLTRDAIAAALGEEIFTDDDLISEIEQRFASLRRPMPASNLRQAGRIPSAVALPNPHGTAPGWLAEKGGRLIAALPGPPREMEPMWQSHVLPRLERLLPGATVMRGLMTFGLGESSVEERIEHVIGRSNDVRVATYVKAAGVEVHIAAHAKDRGEANRLLGEVEAELRKALGAAVFGRDGDTLAEAVGRLMEPQGLTLGVMESCTGGELANLITDRDGSSSQFLGGIVAYSRQLKEANGVRSQVIEEHGMISAETALAMARAVRERLEVDLGVGVTGIAGRESVEGRPAGTCFVATSTPSGDEVREIHRVSSRPAAKQYFALCALDLLRRQLQGVD